MAASRIADFARHVGVDGTDYSAPHRWSVTDLEGCWGAVWEYFDVEAHRPYERVLATETMPGARWFTGATLNYTHHALRHLTDDGVAVLSLDETGAAGEVTGGELRSQVASVAATLRELGVGQGDRVVGYLPNTPQAIVSFLAAASLGAVWSVCGQDYAPQAAADRFAQLAPTALIAADGYRTSTEGTVIALYTDGLVQSRERDVDQVSCDAVVSAVLERPPRDDAAQFYHRAGEPRPSGCASSVTAD